ncbi:MAG: SulP family inorganic anion transporter [Thermodesulfobacteriota bacterium]
MIKKITPVTQWIHRYRSGDLTGDVSAGLIVSVMLIPQGMAYAMLAGLPPVMGLYASTFPLIVYALFGSSRQLAIGPVAMISLLVFAGVSSLAEPGSEKYLGLVLLLTFLVGAMQLLMGFLRLGFFINFFSHAVLSGFTSAAAIVIFVSQLGHLLGIKLSSQHSILHSLMEVGSRIEETHAVALLIGLSSIGIQLVFKWKAPRFPAPLLTVVGSTALVYFLRLDQTGLKVVGSIPSGFPHFSSPPFSLESVSPLVPLAFTILFVGFMESVSVAKLIATKEKYKIDSNQELKGLGLANLVASFFSGYPVTGGFSRTAVNYQSGARTGLASIITGAVVLLVLIFLTPLFYYLPHTVLASIVMVAVMGLVDLKGVKHLFRIKKVDGWTLVLTFVATLTLGSEQGILVGMAFSLLVFIWRSAHPHVAELGYLKQGNLFRNILRYPEAATFPGVLLVRIDASLYFANTGFLEDYLHKRLSERPEVQWVLLDLSGVNDMDAVAVDALEEMMDNYRDQGIRFLFAAMKGPVRDLIQRAGWDEKYGSIFQYPTLAHALKETEKTKR